MATNSTLVQLLHVKDYIRDGEIKKAFSNLSSLAKKPAYKSLYPEEMFSLHEAFRQIEKNGSQGNRQSYQSSSKLSLAMLDFTDQAIRVERDKNGKSNDNLTNLLFAKDIINNGELIRAFGFLIKLAGQSGYQSLFLDRVSGVFSESSENDTGGIFDRFLYRDQYRSKKFSRETDPQYDSTITQLTLTMLEFADVAIKIEREKTRIKREIAMAEYINPLNDLIEAAKGTDYENEAYLISSRFYRLQKILDAE